MAHRTFPFRGSFGTRHKRTFRASLPSLFSSAWGVVVVPADAAVDADPALAARGRLMVAGLAVAHKAAANGTGITQRACQVGATRSDAMDGLGEVRVGSGIARAGLAAVVQRVAQLQPHHNACDTDNT